MKGQIKKIIQASFCLSITKVLAILIFAALSIQSPATASGKKESRFRGVQIGVITYSYRSMPDQTITAILKYVTQSGLSSVELMGGPEEQYGSIPQGNDPQVIRKWRTTISMAKFKEIRKMFNDKGVKIDMLILGDKNWSDEEIDYSFNMCKTLGVRGIWMEISEEAAKRMEQHCRNHPGNQY
ncbi:MAG: hypothetical protein M0R21_11460 [Lentimicrobiaceae bacterium]|nr:hypothetical protein [Lentimicrobiaceae bacterium]